MPTLSVIIRPVCHRALLRPLHCPIVAHGLHAHCLTTRFTPATALGRPWVAIISACDHVPIAAASGHTAASAGRRLTALAALAARAAGAALGWCVEGCLCCVVGPCVRAGTQRASRTRNGMKNKLNDVEARLEKMTQMQQAC